jgi:YbbR domain-containing protein
VARRLRDSLGTAGLAIILSLIIWVNATYQADPPEDRVVEGVPIVVVNAPSGFQPVNEPATAVTLEVRAFQSSWGNLRRDDFSVTADWAGLSEGSHTVTLAWRSSDPTVTILNVYPRQQTLVLESIKRDTREVTLELRDTDRVPLGYRVGTPDITPDLVVVEGPASLVDRVSHLSVSLSLLNQDETVEAILEVRPVDLEGREVKGVNLMPATVTVQVAIERRQNYREVAIRVRTVGQPARGHFVSGVNVLPATVMVVGPPSVIESMGGLVEAAGEIDISGATRMLAENMPLALPEGVSVVGSQEGEIYRVLVTVAIDAVTGGTTVELPVKTKKLQEGLIARLSVPMVDVILTGPAVLLDELETDLLDAYVDLAGLGLGVHQVPPRVDILVTQDSELRALTVTDISPKFIEVTIAEPPVATPTLVIERTATPGITPTGTLTLTATITAAEAVTVEIGALFGITMTPTLTPTGILADVPTRAPTVQPSSSEGTPSPAPQQ